MFNQYENKYYFIEKLDNENEVSYNLRKWIVSRMKPNNDWEFKDSLKIAKLYVNMKVLGVEYDVNIKNLVLEKIDDIFY